MTPPFSLLLLHLYSLLRLYSISSRFPASNNPLPPWTNQWNGWNSPGYNCRTFHRSDLLWHRNSTDHRVSLGDRTAQNYPPGIFPCVWIIYWNDPLNYCILWNIYWKYPKAILSETTCMKYLVRLPSWNIHWDYSPRFLLFFFFSFFEEFFYFSSIAIYEITY